MDKLQIHLKMIPDITKATALDGIPIQRVTRVQTICDVLNYRLGHKNIITKVDKLIKSYLTIPVSTSSAERSFSALRRIKNNLHNSMPQERLNIVHYCIRIVKEQRS